MYKFAHPASRKYLRVVSAVVSLLAAHRLASADSELTNYKSGIDVTWGAGDGSDKGTAYAEEYFYHDKLLDDHKVVYIRSTTAINMAHNSRNIAFGVANNTGVLQAIGLNGLDLVPNTGDEGIIRYKIDRDRQYSYVWADDFPRAKTAKVLPAYTGPFTLASQQFEAGVPVVGTTGSNGKSMTDRVACYFRGLTDSFGDEWHVLSYADDSNVFLRLRPVFVDQAYYADDGKTVLLVVDPKTPCFTARVTGTGQFYTTPPKAYWTPKLVPQTTYISAGSSGTVTIELRDIFGNNVFYRINGGSFVNGGGPSVTLSQDNFSAGSNTLEYYYQGHEGIVKTRTVVKDPAYPSAVEPHGNYLWVDSAGYNTVLSRITRDPYLKWYSTYKTRRDIVGEVEWDANAHRGLRYEGAVNLHGNTYALKNAFLALVNGYDFRIGAGSPKTCGQYAREMLLELSRNIDPLGFEMFHTSDAIPARELHYRGYYDSVPLQEGIFAYDIMIANFKASQVSGGITAIEDYFIRDRFAGFAFEAMQWSADMCAIGSPGMWGGARMLTSVSIAMIMKEYSTPYYGTSGFGSVQTTYPRCPFENDQFTWKQALFDNAGTKKGFPDLTWHGGLSTNGPSGKTSIVDIFFHLNEVPGFKEGDWRVKSGYFSFGLMGTHLCTWANMASMWGGGKSDPLLNKAIDYATRGTLLAAQDPDPTAPTRFPMLTLLNSRFPVAVANALNWVQTLPPTDNNSDDKLMQDAAVFGFAWYDDRVNIPVVPYLNSAKVQITVP